ncbi:MAG: type II toxin-antitoxin system RelE/ParE family toxin [Pelistega sp.]|nr:type II toxin-antitoxin system RelE/ParE family toxin [Pelistega sp.]
MENENSWNVILTERFETWLTHQDKSTRISVLTSLTNLQTFGPLLGRPYADTIKGSLYPNMKELRIQHNGKPIRAFFAFDPLRQAIVLCAADKSNDKLFYPKMLKIADSEFKKYLQNLCDNKDTK